MLKSILDSLKNTEHYIQNIFLHNPVKQENAVSSKKKQLTVLNIFCSHFIVKLLSNVREG